MRVHGSKSSDLLVSLEHPLEFNLVKVVIGIHIVSWSIRSSRIAITSRHSAKQINRYQFPCPDVKDKHSYNNYSSSQSMLVKFVGLLSAMVLVLFGSLLHGFKQDVLMLEFYVLKPTAVHSRTPISPIN